MTKSLSNVSITTVHLRNVNLITISLFNISLKTMIIYSLSLYCYSQTSQSWLWRKEMSLSRISLIWSMVTMSSRECHSPEAWWQCHVWWRKCESWERREDFLQKAKGLADTHLVGTALGKCDVSSPWKKSPIVEFFLRSRGFYRMRFLYRINFLQDFLLKNLTHNERP